MSLFDGKERLFVHKSADDEADEFVVSLRTAENDILNRIVRLSKIVPVKLQFAIKKGANAKEFNLSHTWTPPRTVSNLSAGPLTLLNIEYFAADVNLL